MHTVEHPLRVFVLCITSLVLVFVSEATAQQQRPEFQAMLTACSGFDVNAAHRDFNRNKDTRNSWAYAEFKLPGEAIGCIQAGCYASSIDLSIASFKSGFAQYKGQIQDSYNGNRNCNGKSSYNEIGHAAKMHGDSILIIGSTTAGRPGLLEASDRVLFRST